MRYACGRLGEREMDEPNEPDWPDDEPIPAPKRPGGKINVTLKHKPNWPEIFRAISESIEPKPVEPVSTFCWIYKWNYGVHTTHEPRNWLEPAAAMKLLKRMVSPTLALETLCGRKWGCWPEPVLLNPNLCGRADIPEEAIVLAFYATVKDKI